jgi:hypothetical protein
MLIKVLFLLAKNGIIVIPSVGTFDVGLMKFVLKTLLLFFSVPLSSPRNAYQFTFSFDEC